MQQCSHCLLPCSDAGKVAGEDGSVFCCAGCRAVYEFIRGEGLQAFYLRRDWNPLDSVPAASPGEIDVSPYEELVRQAAEGLELDVYIDGIRCASCVWLVEKVLSRTDGVLRARVNYATHRARVRWNPEEVSLLEILRRIHATGYIPKPYTESEQVLARKAETRELLVRFGTAAFLSSQLMIYSIALYAGYFQGMEPGIRRLLQVIALGLTLPVIGYAGLPFLVSTLAGLKRFRFTMDSLIVTGAGSAFLYSLYQMARGGEVYFDTAAMIVTLVLLGRYLESRARGKASEALQRLAELAPKKAARLTVDASGNVIGRSAVDAGLLRPGDCVEVRPGGKFPADGVVLRGESTADESFITGESRPVPKSSGSAVIGGSVNRSGSLVVRVTGTGKDTVLAGIVRAVEDAQAAKPAIQNLADRVVGIFVPAIFLLAAVTAAAWSASGAGAERALMTGISVLVIACPCSLGLATPLAVLLFTGLASSRGVLIKGGDAVENTASVDHVILDKTGTLTTGSPALREALSLDPSLSGKEALRKAASVEIHSEHGLGEALVEAAGSATLETVSAFHATPGRGVSALLDGRKIAVGNLAFMRENGLAFEEGDPPASPLAGDGNHTLVFMGWEGKVRALFAFADGLREEAEETVRRLRKEGLAVTLVSGDHTPAVAAAAREAGITDFEAEAVPERKRELIAELQKRGRKIMMVGDGVNDAPALTEAAFGVAVGRGTDIAMESGDAVLMRNDLLLLPWILRVSRGALRIIRQNIFWAFFYNATAIPLAAAGFLHPIIAAGAMAASSLFVVAAWLFFLWSVKSGQYDDIEGPKHRMLDEDEEEES
jgi:Cu2+-exporting ATPase